MEKCMPQESYSTNLIPMRKCNLVSMLCRREIGKTRKSSLPFIAKIPLRKMTLNVASTENYTLDKRIFDDHGSGFLGITHNGRYLVSILRNLSVVKIFFFEFTPYHSFLERIITVDTPNGLFYNIETYIPPLGEKFLAVFVYDLTEYRRLTAKENNLPIRLYMSSPSYNFQICISNLIVVISRFIGGTCSRKSAKYYVVAHDNGIILNTGISMINYMFIKKDEILTHQEHVARVRKVWKISRKADFSQEGYSKINLDLGEEILIKTSADEMEDDYEYKLHEEHENLREKREILPIFLSRDYFSVERWLFKVVDNYLRKTPSFSGSALRLLYDFEADIRNVSGFLADVQAFALCEIEAYKDFETSLHEFHLFSIIFTWDLKNCRMSYKAEPHHIGKIDIKLAFGNRWWPLKTGYAVQTTPVHMSLNNSHLLKSEKRAKVISSCDNHLFLTNDD